jgi:prepilin-type N-terminal cleavage/methylation domain-containing protein
MFSDTPHSAFSAQKRPSNSGFTLIELLMVIAIIGVLVAIIFGISNGVRNAQARAQAKAELAVFSQAIDQFKLRDGDYPWSANAADEPEANSELLLQALLGWKKFERVSGETQFIDKVASDVPDTGPKSLIDVSKYRIRQIGNDELYVELPSITSSAPSGYYLADPWGQPYVYAHKKNSGPSNTWEVFGYHLYSMGPDQAHDDSAIDSSTGVMDPDFREAGSGENIDNIYAGE